jgi:hypothetical protein
MLEILAAAALWTFETSKDPFTDQATAEIYSEQGQGIVMLSCKSGSSTIGFAADFGTYIGGYPIIRGATVRIDGGEPFASKFVVTETARRVAVSDSASLGAQVLNAKNTVAVRIDESNNGYGATLVFTPPATSKAGQSFKTKCAEISSISK